MSCTGGELDASEVVEVISETEYARLLGYPVTRRLEGAVRTLAEASRAWYRVHGRPWSLTREVGVDGFGRTEVELAGGVVLSSELLVRRLRRTEARALAVAAVSAGAETDGRVAELWRDQRPDEAFFLDRFGVAVAEHLAMACGEALRWSGGRSGLAALPGYSPGYEGWDLTQQADLHGLMVGNCGSLPGPLRVLASGMLEPKSSSLAIFGLTPRHDLAARAWSSNRCSRCSMTRCDFRRVLTGR